MHDPYRRLKLNPLDAANSAFVPTANKDAYIATGFANYTIAVSDSGVSVTKTTYTGSTPVTPNAVLVGGSCVTPSPAKVTCCHIQKVLTSIPAPNAVPSIWQWYQTASNVYNYVTVTGDVSCDQSVFVPSNTYLVLDGKVTAAGTLDSVSSLFSMSGTIASSVNPTGGAYSGIIAKKGSQPVIDCNYKKITAIKAFNVTNGLIEGITVQNCGKQDVLNPVPAIWLQGFKGKNTTEVSHCTVQNNAGIGILVQKSVRALIYKNTIYNNSIGVAVIVGSSRTMVIGNTITNNRGNGISSDSASTTSVFDSNTISFNGENGIALYNLPSSASATSNGGFINGSSYAAGTSQDNVIIRNIITSNRGASIHMSAEGTSAIAGTKIVGNTISMNGFGVRVGDNKPELVFATLYFNNNDKDGLTHSFLRYLVDLTKGDKTTKAPDLTKSSTNNRVLDPLNRAVYFTPLQTAVLMTGSSLLSFSPKASHELQSTSFNNVEASQFTQVLTTSMDPHLQPKHLTIVNTTDSGDHSSTIVNWQVKFHLEETAGTMQNSSVAYRTITQSLTSGNSNNFYAYLKAKGGKFSQLSKATHKVQGKKSFPERAGYEAPVGNLATPVLTKVKVPKTPAKKPTKKPTAPKKGKKKSNPKYDVFSWFDAIFTAMFRAFL